MLRNAFAGLKIRKNALREYKNKDKITIVELQLSFNKKKISLQGLKIAGFCTQNNNTVKKIKPAKPLRPGLNTAIVNIKENNNMHSLFITILTEKFANQFTIESDEDHSFIRFPAKSPEFGDVDIYEESPGAYIVNLGKFTHSHFDCYEGSEDEQIKIAAENIIDFLEELFADSVICYGTDCIGGSFSKGHYKDDKRPGNYDYYVWSGIYKRAN